jgi:hypothetical protein
MVTPTALRHTTTVLIIVPEPIIGDACGRPPTYDLLHRGSLESHSKYSIRAWKYGLFHG